MGLIAHVHYSQIADQPPRTNWHMRIRRLWSKCWYRANFEQYQRTWRSPIGSFPGGPADC